MSRIHIVAVCILRLLAIIEATLPTCGDVKLLYGSEQCCGQPAKRLSKNPFSGVSGIAECEKTVNALAGVPGAMFTPNFCADLNHVMAVGTRGAPIAEATDAGSNAMYLIDGQAGDTNWPHGALKVLATAGEVNPETGEMLTGVPDGQGAYLKDGSTVRFMYQSESYGPLSRQETLPYKVNDDKRVTFTGSHVHYIDLDREGLATYFDEGAPANAAGFVRDSGEAIKTVYNLKRQLVGPRNRDGPSDAPHHSNVDIRGNYIVVKEPSKADWLMQSLCSAHVEPKHQWGPGVGVEDTLYITNEEWISYEAEADGLIGLPAHVLNPKTKEMYATSAFTLGGFEKIVEVNTGTTDYVAFAPSGYNGAFGGSFPHVVAQRNGNYTRTDGQPYVWPQNIVPTRLFLGKKHTDKDGNADSVSFLARNGLEFGALYGFATDCSVEGIESRDSWHKNASKAGEQVVGAFYKMRWKDTPGEVKDFVHDGSWEYQDAPEGAPAGWCFWNGQGKDSGGSKTEHISPDPRGGLRVLQSSTAGYFGIYEFSALTDLLSEGEFPSSIPATYTCLQPESDIVDQVILNGKGQYADGQDARYMPDKGQNPGKSTFEDIDAVEWIAAKGGEDYIIIHEDGGNDFGERKFLAKVATPMQYYFVAMSGGPLNSRQKAGVSAVAGSFKAAASHEFSGATDLSGMLAKDSLGNFRLPAGDVSGLRRQLEAETAIDDKIFSVSLQAHSQWGGWTESFNSDATGQILVYKPDLSNARLL
eukprot:TRINITY_DN1913_c0_g1_i4.p1 TRINITY_DN1913_c0_g1~~TRINITY_DN1913_c0_g1_i4.p1  ORF type:complete len:756 (-),score=155.51 TRINITY_DN1913_c0_g1_i4:94-2361(-)